MLIQNTYLERHFEVTSGSFYTSKFVNRLSNVTIQNTSGIEFRIFLMNGIEILSSDLAYSILQEEKERCLVRFFNSQLSLDVLYLARESVLSKQITINHATEAINYIDLECIDFENKDGIYYPKKQEAIKEMGNFAGYYAELGQPVYAKTLFFGQEFPLSENRVAETKYVSRYYLGYAIDQPRTLWPAIVGASTSNDKEAMQHYFFRYIESISQPSYLRKQYNSWYDHMTNITEKIILDSFSEIYHGFEDYGVHLDAYVVDDGWCNYESVWEFNQKFPNGLTPIKQLVNQLDSSLGLWIGPRGGYNGTEITMSDWLEAHPELQIGSKNKRSNDVNVADFNYLRKMKEKMLEYQEEFDISYWKIDGWLLQPDTPDITGEYAMHTMTPVYEFLVELLSDLRKARGNRDCWLNLTSYVNPSPWFLQWVNSLWIQISQDVGFTENGGNDINRMLTYRDCQYHEFLHNREFQLPLSALYNHEPIYASTAHTWYLDEPISATVSEFEDYLMFIATRGNAFWEFHYSYSMFDEERWKANARAIKWIESHYAILKYAKAIGGNPNHFDIYGYRCQQPETKEEILSLRNPSDRKQRIKIEGIDFSHYEVIRGSSDSYSLSSEEIELQPYTVLILEKNKY